MGVPSKRAGNSSWGIAAAMANEEMADQHPGGAEATELPQQHQVDILEEPAIERKIDFSKYPEYEDLPIDEKSRLRLGDAYHVHGRAVVGFDDLQQDHFLKYYADDKMKVERIRSFKYVRTGKSRDDDDLKIPFRDFMIWHGVVILLYAIIPFVFVAFFHYVPGDMLTSVESLRQIFIAASALIFLVPIVFAVWLSNQEEKLKRRIVNNFVATSSQLNLGISWFLGDDIATKLSGVRKCMVTFRQFIKWRRYLNFFTAVYDIVIRMIITICLIGVAVSLYVIVLIKNLDWFSFGVVAFSMVSSFMTILYYRLELNRRFDWLKDVTALYSEGRDPTIPICVMIAEMHRRYVIRNAGRA